MSFAHGLALIVGLLVGVPLVVIGLAALGPVGWIAAAVLLPLATLGTILWFGWARRSPDDGPERIDR